jgi:hypothetical protein
MSRQNEKTEHVRFQFERFSELCDCIPTGEVQIWEGTILDPPDVCIGNYELGIEFVEFVHGRQSNGSDMRAAETEFDEIVSTAQKLFNQQNEQENRVEWQDFADTCLEHYLDSIHIRKTKSSEFEHWYSPRAAYVGFGCDSFAQIVRIKEKRLPYKQKFASVWLVIVAAGGAMSSIVSPDQTVVPGCIKSQFDRVYFFNMPAKQIIRLTAE